MRRKVVVGCRDDFAKIGEVAVKRKVEVVRVLALLKDYDVGGDWSSRRVADEHCWPQVGPFIPTVWTL